MTSELFEYPRPRSATLGVDPASRHRIPGQSRTASDRTCLSAPNVEDYLQMSVFGEIQKGAAVVRISRSYFQGRERIDIREWYKPATGEELRPSQRGVSLEIGQLPALLSAMRAAAKSAVSDGLLNRADFERTERNAKIDNTTGDAESRFEALLKNLF